MSLPGPGSRRGPAVDLRSRLSPQKLLQGGERRFGFLDVLAGVLRILVFEGGFGALEVRGHHLFRRGNVVAQAEPLRLKLTAKTRNALLRGGGAGGQLIELVLEFIEIGGLVGSGGCIGRGLGS